MKQCIIFMKQGFLLDLSARKRLEAWAALLILFVFIFFLTSLSYFFPNPNGLWGIFVRYHFEAMLLLAFGGIGMGAFSYYLFSGELQRTQHSLQHSTRLLLSFLNGDEKQCVQFLLEHGGRGFQSDLAKLPGMTRLKAHRIVSKLSERKIIQVHSNGKANLLYLSPEIQEGTQPFSNKPSTLTPEAHAPPSL